MSDADTPGRLRTLWLLMGFAVLVVTGVITVVLPEVLGGDGAAESPAVTPGAAAAANTGGPASVPSKTAPVRPARP